MLMDKSPDLEAIELVANATQAICMLPAVATQGWCKTAAETLVGFRPRAVAAVTIGRVNHEAKRFDVESFGSAGAGRVELENLNRRFSGDTAAKWPLNGDLGSEGKLARGWGVEQSLESRVGQASRGWRELGVSDLLLGAAVMHTASPSRLIVVECGRRVGDRSFEEADADAMRALIGVLARRGALAFGAGNKRTSAALTMREEEVLSQLTLGKSVKQIAADMMRSPHTVHDHVKSLHRKLNASSRGELIARALGHLGEQATCEVRTEAVGLGGAASLIEAT